MKVFTVIAKLLAALATVIGAVYLLATYGDKIVAWCKNLIDSLPEVSCFNPDEDEDEEDEDEEPEVVEIVEADEEAPIAEAIEDVVEEVVEVAEEVVDSVIADDADFEG